MIKENFWGNTKEGKAAKKYILSNAKGMEVTLSDFGASILAVKVSDKTGALVDVLLGYDTLEEWKKHIEEYTENLEKQQRDREKQDGVILCTMHSSKGLEFPIVFIPEANEGITPYQKAVLKEEIEEERRLFYVAMTRAKELLYVFSIKERFHKAMDVSRFVDEFLQSDELQKKNMKK